jgi:hypothetical protein
MDLVVAGGEDQLLKSLDFSLGKTAQYVQERRLVSFYPSGASNFAPNGVRVCRFTISGEHWLDPSSLRVYFKLQNLSTTESLKLGSGAHVLFDRIRLLIGGTVVEDVGPLYGRTHEMLRRHLMPSEWCLNEAIESGQQATNDVARDGVSPMTLDPSGQMTLNFTPLLSILNCGKYLPLAFAPMQLELTLADSAAALFPGSTGTYQIENMSLRASVVRLDSAVQASFSNLLMQNRALTIPLNTLHVQQQTVPANSTEVNVQAVRAFSRLNVLFVTFLNAPASGNEVYTQPHVSFPNPSAETNTQLGSDSFLEHTLRWQAQIGSKLYPEAPATSIPESFSILRQAVGVYDESIRTLNITPQAYKDGKYILAVPLMNVPGQFASGLNTRSGDLLSFRASNIATAGGGLGRVVLTFVNESILELREGSVTLLD